ncbi:hypothetical protein LHK_02693 [Laribacter hongkongensis HLHK9]|uniref:Uncharacterized protein n=1 Tax=Laribacter hongkongensis (strain HLHK9) TaxID=557598 RepID=C1DCQ4_LARHH|nr:hypothetical protein LHK_02693 [Laribacter hongkongensis HLHK9]
MLQECSACLGSRYRTGALPAGKPPFLSGRMVLGSVIHGGPARTPANLCPCDVAPVSTAHRFRVCAPVSCP